MRSHLRPLVVLVLSALTPRAAAQAPPSYTVEFLGAGAGIAALSDAGELVGTTSVGANQRAWVARSGMPVTPLPLPPGRTSSNALDVNELGVVVGAVSSSSSPEFGSVAAIWTPDGAGGYAVAELGKLQGHSDSQATALNNLGDVVGWSKSGMFRYPVLFHVGGAPQDLSSTGVFDPRSINDQRVLVDGSFTVKRLDLDTMIVEDLGVPTGLPTSFVATSAAAINESNQVAGAAILATSTSCDREAARYTDGVGWEVFTSCGPYNGCSDIDAQGDVVMLIGLSGQVRFEGLGIYAIEDLIENTVGHWSLFTLAAGKINDARQIATKAQNSTTGEAGVVLLSPIGPGATTYCSGDGTGAACPCGNAGAPGHGCANGSEAAGCELSGTGAASVAADSFTLHAAGSTPGQPGLFFQGDTAVAGGGGLPFGDGLRCAGGVAVRLQTRNADATGSARSTIGIAARGGASAGDLLRYQWWYRDPSLSPCGAGFNLSNGVEVSWAP